MAAQSPHGQAAITSYGAGIGKWEWIRTRAGCYQTPFGVIDLDVDDWSVVVFYAQLAWKANLWWKESRSMGCDVPEGMTPCVEAQKAAMRSTGMGQEDKKLKDAALMASMAARGLERKAKVVDHDIGEVRCACGTADPSRDHMLWQCSHDPPPDEPPEMRVRGDYWCR